MAKPRILQVRTDCDRTLFYHLNRGTTLDQAIAAVEESDWDEVVFRDGEDRYVFSATGTIGELDFEPVLNHDRVSVCGYYGVLEHVDLNYFEPLDSILLRFKDEIAEESVVGFFVGMFLLVGYTLTGDFEPDDDPLLAIGRRISDGPIGSGMAMLW